MYTLSKDCCLYPTFCTTVLNIFVKGQPIIPKSFVVFEIDLKLYKSLRVKGSMCPIPVVLASISSGDT